MASGPRPPHDASSFDAPLCTYADGYHLTEADFDPKDKDFVYVDRRLCKQCGRYALGGARVASWFASPKLVPIHDLMVIEQFYLARQIPRELYDRWLAVNYPNYGLAGSDATHKLWFDRLAHLSDLIDQKDVLAVKAHLHAQPELAKFVSCSNSNGTYRVHFVRRFNINTRTVPESFVSFMDICFPYSSNADKAATNLSFGRLCAWLIRQGRWAELKPVFELYPIGRFNCTIVSHLCAILGSDHVDIMLSLFSKDRVFRFSNSCFGKYLKSVTTAVRRTGCWVDRTPLDADAVAHLVYWEMPFGRSKWVSNWSQEMSNRCSKTTHVRYPDDGSEVYPELKSILIEIMGPLVVSSRNWTDWPTFVRDRQRSSGGMKADVDGESVTLMKRAYFDKVTDTEMDTWLDEVPAIKGTGSEKYELGKARAIYGTGVVDYAIVTYVTRHLESLLYLVPGVEMGLGKMDEFSAILRRLRVIEEARVETTMLDYADFNLQHTPEVQSLVFTALAEVLRSVDRVWPPDLIKAVAWCEAAFTNQWVKFPHRDDSLRVRQGLFSGVRCTSFMNTLLNLAYFRLVSGYVVRTTGLVPLGLHHVHQGDDVWVSNSSRLWAAELFKQFQAFGFEMQPSKQLFDVGVGEFLRVRYAGGVARGYLMRAISSFILRPTQSADMSTPLERCSALSAQVNVLVRRGLNIDFANGLWRIVIDRVRRFYVKEGSRKTTVPLAVVCGPRSNGGFGICPPGMASQSAGTAPRFPRLLHSTRQLSEAIPSNSAAAAAREMSYEFKNALRFESVVDALHRSNLTSSMRPIDKSTTLRLFDVAIRRWSKRTNSLTTTFSSVIFDEYLGYDVQACDLTTIFHRLASPGLPVKRSSVLRTPPAAMFSAIASSPFKDINSAMIALDLPMDQAARIAVECCPDVEKRSAGLHAYMTLSGSVSREIFISMLRCGGMVLSEYESLLHPIVLSWASDYAFTFAVRYALLNRITKISDWHELHALWSRRVASTSARNPTLLSISKY